MKSGNPDPVDDLKLIIQTKTHAPAMTIEVVSKAARWLKASLKGAGIHYDYSSCTDDHYGFAAFTIHRDTPTGESMNLELNIAEICSSPFVFAQVRKLSTDSVASFPFFGDLRSDGQRELLLHYIADFIISTEG